MPILSTIRFKKIPKMMYNLLLEVRCFTISQQLQIHELLIGNARNDCSRVIVELME